MTGLPRDDDYLDTRVFGDVGILAGFDGATAWHQLSAPGALPLDVIPAGVESPPLHPIEVPR